jgi:prepilin-type N-terminal cleavage/methylation domain-containing protein
MRRGTGGLTLIETLVVIAIAAILLVIAIPSFNDSQARKRVEGTAGELHTDLQYAKSQAAATNQAVTFVTTAHGYTISGTTNFKTLTTDSRISLTDAITVTFEPYRAFPTTGAGSSIDVAHSGSTASLRVSVDAMGGVRTCSANGVVKGYAAC